MRTKQAGFLYGLTVFFLCTASLSAAAETSLTPLTVGVPADRCPIFYKEHNSDTVTGIGIDLMRIAAERAGFAPTFRYIEEENVKQALDSPLYDVVLPLGSAITSAKGKHTLVTDNLFQTPFTIVTVHAKRKLSLNILHVGMLESLKGGADTIQQLYPGITITFYKTTAECVHALRAKKVDALLHNSYVWSYLLQKPAYKDLAVQPLVMFPMDFRAGVTETPKGKALIEKLNGGIATLTDTQRQAVILEYTPRSLYRYTAADYLYRYGLFLLLTLLLTAGSITLAIIHIRTTHLKHEEKLRQLMNQDLLTGVLSMSAFRVKAKELLRSHPDKVYVLSYSNIRDFKYINESLGMDAGDELLCFWADKGKSITTDEDALGRIDADHFAILRHLDSLEQLDADVKSVVEPVRDFFINRNQEIRVQICTGVYVVTPDDLEDIQIDKMLDCARLAESRLRKNHKSNFEFYNEEQWKTGKLVVDLANHLPAAIESNEVQVWYQPQVDYTTGIIIGAEALTRWNSTNRGWGSPADFIPALEETGLVFDLDLFVWERACQDLHRWNQEGKHRTVSVNLSRADFAKDTDIPNHFLHLIQTYQLSPDQLHIEITESAYVDNPELLINTTNRLRRHGFQVEMDDFGSGYSSLNMLKEVQVDRIKLDLHFLTETGDQRKGRIIIEHIINMAQALGMEVIAEGVEYKDQACFLKELGCTEMQGFLFQKPMPAKEFDMLASVQKV
ncbi:MAG: EAL domain-containing protein [Treponema sp.]|nr:EAL domain-containing protein [Treponema sp.]